MCVAHGRVGRFANRGSTQTRGASLANLLPSSSLGALENVLRAHYVAVFMRRAFSGAPIVAPTVFSHGNRLEPELAWLFVFHPYPRHDFLERHLAGRAHLGGVELVDYRRRVRLTSHAPRTFHGNVTLVPPAGRENRAAVCDNHLLIVTSPARSPAEAVHEPLEDPGLPAVEPLRLVRPALLQLLLPQRLEVVIVHVDVTTILLRLRRLRRLLA
mmetsp:Transcript_9653/g.40962  ORF Transcript_9653/g.40962 Transcript_9653/m.40962 type:complete len:214 (-) Transcript_9653:224-865(-)